MTTEITPGDIESAAERIGPHVRRTPILDLGDPFDSGYRLSLKLDSAQPTGSFKVRGAFSALTAMAVPEEGVAAASGGNFGLAVAYAAARLGLRSTVFVPSTSPEEKIGRIAAHGAEVRVVPGYYRDALEESRRWAAGSGAVEVHAFDQPEVVAGQGTCGREITEQVPDVGAILVAVGGGGLIGGIASWVRDAARVVAVEPELCPTLHSARAAGRPVEVDVGGVAASALGASCLGAIPWAANQWIRQSLMVSDLSILDSQRWLWETCRVLAEPAACAPIAALTGGGYTPAPGEHVVALVSGANTPAL
ncbi:MAG TPA: threonine/serine dehydratase [Acidimicrobiia bacterium]|nr:threonine/serine dehydratase [Acidimicrobiia bacterium]